MSSNLKKPLIVGITGASGAVYGVRLLEILNTSGIETHLIVSRAAQLTFTYETDLKLSDLEKLATAGDLVRLVDERGLRKG